MSAGAGLPTLLPSRLKLPLLVVVPLVVAGSVYWSGNRSVDVEERAKQLARFSEQLLDQALGFTEAVLYASPAERRSLEFDGRLGDRLEGAGILDRFLEFEDWEGTPVDPPPDFGEDPNRRFWVHVDGVRTRLLVRAGPDGAGRSALGTFVIDSRLPDMRFDRLLPHRWTRGTAIDIDFLDASVEAKDLDPPPDALNRMVESPLSSVEVMLPLPDGGFLGRALIRRIPPDHLRGQRRSAAAAAGCLVFLLLLGFLYDWRTLASYPRGLPLVLLIIVGGRLLLAWVRAPSVLFPREVGAASLYGSSEAWRLLASPGDFLLTAFAIYLICLAIRVHGAAVAQRRRGVALAWALPATSLAIAAVVQLTTSVGNNTGMPLLERPGLLRWSGTTLLSLGLVLAMLGAAELAALTWRLLRGGTGRRLPGTGRLQVGLCFLVVSVGCAILLQALDKRVALERLRSELAPQVLEQTARRSVALTATMAYVAEAFSDDRHRSALRNTRAEYLAYRFWSGSALSLDGYKSSLDFYSTTGTKVSHFGFDLPELDEELAQDDLDGAIGIVEEAFEPDLLVSQNLLHASVPVSRDGLPLGIVVGHVLDEPSNLPFLPWSQPYLAALGPGSPPHLWNELGGGPHYVLYDAYGKVLVSTIRRPPAKSDAMTLAAERGTTVRVRSAGEPFVGLALQDDFRLHLLLVAEKSPLARLSAAVRLALFGLLVLGLLSLVPRLVRRSGVSDLVRALRGSFYRKLLTSLLLASIIPLVGLALFLQTYIERRSTESVNDSAIQSVSIAQRVLEDYAATQLEGGPVLGVELDDNILYWLRGVVGQEIHIYEEGRLRASSKRELFRSGLLPGRLDGRVQHGLVRDGLPYLVIPTRLGPGTIPVAYAPVRGVDPSRGLVAAVPMVLEQRQIARAVERVVEMILLATVVLVGLLTVAASWLARAVARPVRDLVEATDQIAGGDYATRLEAQTHDEVAELVDGFNSMAAALAAQRSDLERRRDYMERLLRHATTGVISIDPLGRVVTLNPAARALLAPASNRLEPGVEIRDALQPFDELRPLARVLSANAGPRGVPEEVDFERDGTPRRFRLVRVNLPGGTAGSLGTLFLLDDVTELMRSNQLAAWAEMAQAIAHEIKNPLTPIQLSTEHLQRLLEDHDLEPSPAVQACLQTIIKQVRTLYEIAGEFSAYARLPALAPVPTDPVEFMREVVSPYRAAPPDGVELDESYADVGRAAIDRRALGRAIVNLIENALQAMPDGGRLTLAVESNGPRSEVVFSVGDSGGGLDPEVRRRLFEPYFSTKTAGMGLGLAIVRRSVEAHHGRIDVNSESGRGTVFRIRLPLLANG